MSAEVLHTVPKVVPSAGEAEMALRTLLRFIGEDPAREGLRDTPARVLRAWREAFRDARGA